ncbi:glycerophosphoryl diester phosphodiesterase membrane domain-containing protein [Streptococcus dentiloxodontae]
MIQSIKTVLTDLYTHKFTYILRATLLQLGVTVVGGFVLSAIFQSILVSIEVPGLTTDNLSSFFGNPLTVFLLFVYLFSLAFFIYLEFSLLVEIIRHKEARLRLGLKRLKEDSLNFFKSVASWHILAFLIYLLLTIPFLKILFSSSLVENIYIPKFISAELMKSLSGKILYGSLYAVLAYLNLRFIYTLPLTVTGKGERFAENMKESWRLTKGRNIFSLIGLLPLLFLLLLALNLVGLLFVGAASFLDSNTSNNIVETVFLCMVWGIHFGGNLLFKLAFLSYLLALLGKEQADFAEQQAEQFKQHRIWALSILLIVIGGVSYFLKSQEDLSGDPRKIAVIAHRGDVNKGVENSLEALEAAAKEGADYVEMDVILSKDGQFVVSHDDNLERLTGKSLKISESKASDVVGLPIKQNTFKSQLVSFETYVNKAKELGVKLLIELKPTGSEPSNYEQLFVQKLEELGGVKEYLVMSLDLKTIEKVEQLNSSIKTGDTISFQIGDFASKTVDFYAIEDFSYQNWLASWAHAANKQVFAWTINSEEDIENYLQKPVDGIITDYPSLVVAKQKELAKDDSYMDYFLRLMNLS